MHVLDYASPIGIIEIKGMAQGISSILFADRVQIQYKQNEETPSLLVECYTQLDEYFKGQRKAFSITFQFEGTDFQRSVWQALTTVLYGQTASYKHIATIVGNEKAVRAVGTTNSRNLISIVVPCHRIIGSNGKLTGYAGGLWRKQWLLEHEQNYWKSENNMREENL